MNRKEYKEFIRARMKPSTAAHNAAIEEVRMQISILQAELTLAGIELSSVKAERDGLLPIVESVDAVD